MIEQQLEAMTATKWHVVSATVISTVPLTEAEAMHVSSLLVCVHAVLVRVVEGMLVQVHALKE